MFSCHELKNIKSIKETQEIRSLVRLSGLDKARYPNLGKVSLTLKFCEDLSELYAPFHVTKNLYFPANNFLRLNDMILHETGFLPPQMGSKQRGEFLPSLDRPAVLLSAHQYHPSPLAVTHSQQPHTVVERSLYECSSTKSNPHENIKVMYHILQLIPMIKILTFYLIPKRMIRIFLLRLKVNKTLWVSLPSFYICNFLRFI